MNLYQPLLNAILAGKKQFAVLIDPDKYSQESLSRIVTLAMSARIDYFFLGGSLLLQDNQSEMITFIKEHTDIPVVLFPGNNMQLNNQADGILLLSLISGRNPDMLIGRHAFYYPDQRAADQRFTQTGPILQLQP